MSLYDVRDTDVLLGDTKKITIVSSIQISNYTLNIWIFTLLSLAIALSALGCGGAKPAREELSKTRDLLETVRKKGCAHDSLTLAEQAYAKSQKLFDDKKFDESRTQAAVAHQLAQEASKAIGDTPCELPPTEPQEDQSDVKPSSGEDEDREVEPFTEEATSELKTIHFKFDSVAFSPDALKILEENLTWIRSHPDESVVISGHCDERGTAEYNLALGDKRAQKVANYLKQSNIDDKRLEIVTYGSERPISFRHDAEGHRLNRRVEFSIVRR
jgi:peptidoglycan-associated lipoprotein